MRLKPRSIIKFGSIAVIFAGVCILASWWAPPVDPVTGLGAWYSILPPMLAIVMALTTKRVFVSLGFAVVAGGWLVYVPSAPLSPGAWANGSVQALQFIRGAVTNKDYLMILAFVPPIFAMISVIIAIGGFKGVVVWLSRWAKGPKSAQLVTALMGLLLFIDDYTNTIVVGAAMRPITDRYRISREKLAFLVDATGAPISGIAFISSWIAFEVGLFSKTSETLGLGREGYAMFFDALGFRFYCLLMLIFVFFHIITGCDFGPMKKAEDRVRSGGPLDGRSSDRSSPSPELSQEPQDDSGVKPRALNAFLPLGALLSFHMIGLWFDGGGPAAWAAGGSLLDWTYWRGVIGQSENTIFILLLASLFGLSVAIVCGTASASLTPGGAARCIWNGTRKSFMPAGILILAWSLKEACDGLGTDRFLVTLLTDKLSPMWFPAVLFIIASLTSFATGTSWGTMAILIPTAIPIAFQLDGQVYGLVTIISLAATLDGAIFGDHCSPISDTTIMSSVSSSCDHIQHVRTQLPYSLFVAFLTLVCGYIPAASGMAWGWCIASAMAAMGLIFFVLNWMHRPSGGGEAA